MKGRIATALLFLIAVLPSAAFSQPAEHIDGLSASGERFVYYSLNHNVPGEALLQLIGREYFLPASTGGFQALKKELGPGVVMRSENSLTATEYALPKALEVLGRLFHGKMVEFDYVPKTSYLYDDVHLQGQFRIWSPTQYGRGWLAESSWAEPFVAWVVQLDSADKTLAVTVMEKETYAKLTFRVRPGKPHPRVFNVVWEPGCICSCKSKLKPNLWSRFQPYAGDLPFDWFNDGWINKAVQALSTDGRPLTGEGCQAN